MNLTIDGHPLIVRAATAAELVDLRHRILRAGLPRSEAIFPGDELPRSAHFGAFDGASAVCCATFHEEPYRGEPAYRLRGMATDDGFRGKGIGHAVLRMAEKSVCETFAVSLLWCNAREPAVRFYQDMGWEIVSDRFDIPTAGPHFIMIKRLD